MAAGVRRVAVFRVADDVHVAAVVWVVAFRYVVVLQGAVILVVVVWIVFAGLVLVVLVVELQVVEVLVVGNLIIEVLVAVVFAAGVSVVVVPFVEALIAAVSVVQLALDLHVVCIFKCLHSPNFVECPCKSCAPSGCQRHCTWKMSVCWWSACHTACKSTSVQGLPPHPPTGISAPPATRGGQWAGQPKKRLG